MFIMMNRARHAVGIEGYGIAERAYQRALNFARERIQGRAVGAASSERSPIIRHPDIQRMLLDMRSRIEAMRALSLYTAAAADRARHHPDSVERTRGQSWVDMLIPVVKGWSSEVGNEITALALQVHGGMGFIEETGAAQHYRDARITTIYEGTTGIQAADLVGRKLLRDGGETAVQVINVMRAELTQIRGSSSADVAEINDAVSELVDRLSEASEVLLERATNDPRAPFAASFSYLMLWGITAGGWQMARAAEAAQRCLETGDGDNEFYRSKLLSCLYYARQVIPHGEAHARGVLAPEMSSQEIDELVV
jgi:hypothetical protein